MNKDRPIPPEDVSSLTFYHTGIIIFPSHSTNRAQASIQSGVHHAVIEDYNAMVKTIRRLMVFSRLQDHLVDPCLVPGFDELVEGRIQRVVAAITRALENFAVNAEHWIGSLASDPMQERFLDMLAEAHCPRHHLVVDATGADGVIDDLGRVEEDVEGVMPVSVTECGVANLKSYNLALHHSFRNTKWWRGSLYTKADTALLYTSTTDGRGSW